MNRIIIAALEAGWLASTAGGALAQATPAPAAPPSAETPSLAVEGGAPIELGAVDEKTSVTIVLLSALPVDASPLDVKEDADELATLHASIEDNAAVKAKLDAGGYTIGDVVGVANNVDGSTIVYVDDRG